MYTLYQFPMSPASRRVVSLLAHCDLPFEQRNVDMMAGQHMSPEYLTVNANHQVPTLLDGDLKIHESNAILRYLCNRHALESWYPTNDRVRARVDQWLDWTQCRFVPTMRDIVLNEVFLGEKGDKAAAQRGREHLNELFEILENAIGTSFLVDDTPTIADLSLASCFYQLTFAAIQPESPKIRQWFDRVSQLKGFQASLPMQAKQMP
jgi:glutathione S-transferase